MIKRANEIKDSAKLKEGNPKLSLCALADFANQPECIKMHSVGTLMPGGELPYHTHIGECEFYYILSGTGEYNDNGEITTVSAGDFTYTTDGEGHGMKNTGEEPIVFIPLIVKY